jgi:hypothetical protein
MPRHNSTPPDAVSYYGYSYGYGAPYPVRGFSPMQPPPSNVCH